MLIREGPPAISPRARRAAKKLLVPFQALPIPAPGRRITERDVQAAAAAFEAVAMTAKARKLAFEKGLDAGTLARIANGRPLEIGDIQKLPAVPLRLPAERVKMSAEELAQIEALGATVRATPVASVSVFVLASAIQKSSSDGNPVPYVIKAVGSLLAEDEFRQFRAVIDGTDWIYRGQINVAAHLQNNCSEGKSVLIRNADRLSVAQILAAIEEVSADAVQCTGAMVKVQALEGSGISFETARLAAGESAVLTLSPLQLRPQLRGKISAGVSLENGWEMTLTFDERLVLKKSARILILRLKSLLENASNLL
jgi:pyruvate/2-oxoglutarate dehydrogenase complex dihydrolipoamide acyltransferase (E2) component